MKARLVLLSLLVVAALIPAGVASANEVSSGCTAVNDPVHDDHGLIGIVRGETFYAGEVLTVSATEPSTFGTPLTVNLWINNDSVGRVPFPGSISYEIPETGTYNLVVWIIGGGTGTWQVDCAPVSADADGDGVLDEDDVCADTVLPDVPTKNLKRNHFAAQADGSFDSANDKLDGLYTVADTAGCSATQIVERAELGKGHLKHGLSKGELESFIASLAG